MTSTHKKNFCTPHCHIRSFDAASTPEAFANKETELGTGCITITDHGTLEGAREVYDLAKSRKMTPIIGLEGYFRDDNCPILIGNDVPKDEHGTFQDWAKYEHITMHFMDQKAFEVGSKILSNAFDRAEKHGTERKPLFGWSELETLGSYNVTGTSGCLIGMVARHLTAQNNFKVAEQYYEKLRSCFKPGNFYVEIFPHTCDTYWREAIFIEWEDGVVEEFKPKRKVATEAKLISKNTGGILVEDLAAEFERDSTAARFKHKFVYARMIDRKWHEIPKRGIKGVTRVEGLLKNECRDWASDGDVQLGANRFLMQLAEKHGDPILISDDSHFAEPKEYIAQTVRLTSNGWSSWRFAQSHHRMDGDTAWNYFKERMGLPESKFEEWTENTYQWASKFKDFSLVTPVQLPTKFYPKDTLKHTYDLVSKHGRMKWDNPEYVERLNQEIELLHKNGKMDLLPYFFICEEATDLYSKAGQLTGPGRGSAAGLLLSYLMGIVHVNPLKYGLSKDRFLTLDRIQTGKMPDIDMDFGTGELLVNKLDPTKGWLPEKFGECFAQISTDHKLHPKGAIKDVFRAKFGRVPEEIEQICKQIPMTPQGTDDTVFVYGQYDDEGVLIVPGIIETSEVLKGFIKKYPEEWESVEQVLGLTRQKSRHASAFVISDTPISDTCPTMILDNIRCTQYTAKSVEASGLLKFDFLKLKSALDVQKAIGLIQKTESGTDWTKDFQIDGEKTPGHMVIPFGGQKYSIWNIPDDYSVYNSLCEGQTETVFQLNTVSATRMLKYFDYQISKTESGMPIKALNSINSLAAFTALDRPGPLDAFVTDTNGSSHNMLVEYANRAKGGAGIGRIKVLDELCPETFGVLVYQEQLTKIFRELGGATAIQAENFRGHVSKKEPTLIQKDKILFMNGAVQKLGAEEAEKVWGLMETFGRYGFNKSHAVCYMKLGYATAFLKHHFPLQWWCAVLQNAKRDKVTEEFWKYCKKYVNMPSIKNCSNNFQIQGDRIIAPLWLLGGVGEKAQEQISEYAPYKDLEDFCNKMEEHKRKHPKTKKVTQEDGSVVEEKCDGRSAVDKRVTNALIISGAMDELFPEYKEYPLDGQVHKLKLSLGEKIELFEETQAKAKKKKIKKIDNVLTNITDLERFQYAKQIMPVYVEDLRPLAMMSKTIKHPEKIFERDGDALYRIKIASLEDGKKFELVEDGRMINMYDTMLVPGQWDSTRSAIGYIVSQEFFDYSNGSRQACKFVIDIDGYQFEKVKWPPYDGGKLGTLYTDPLEGSVVLVTFKEKPGNPLDLGSIVVIQPSLKSQKKDSKNE